MDLISHQGLNRGTVFPEAELATLGLHGILPPRQGSWGGRHSSLADYVSGTAPTDEATAAGGCNVG